METLNQRKRENREGESDGDIPEQKKVGRFHARHVSCLRKGPPYMTTALECQKTNGVREVV